MANFRAASEAEAIPFDGPDATPEEGEIRMAVKDGLKRGRAGGALQINGKHIKHWLLEAEEEKKVERKGRGDIVTWEQLANVRATSESHMGYGHSHMADDMGHHGTPAKRRYRFQRDRFAQAFFSSCSAPLQAIFDRRSYLPVLRRCIWYVGGFNIDWYWVPQRFRLSVKIHPLRCLFLY